MGITGGVRWGADIYRIGLQADGVVEIHGGVTTFRRGESERDNASGMGRQWPGRLGRWMVRGQERRRPGICANPGDLSRRPDDGLDAGRSWMGEGMIGV